MKFELVTDLSNKLKQLRSTTSFMEVVELRQRSFRQNKANVCFLDPYDLISDHLILRSERDGKAFGYSRVTSHSMCRKHDLAYPLEPLLTFHPDYRMAYEKFMARGNEALHMGFLCLDPAYKDEVAGVKIVDLMIWLGFVHSGFDLERVSFSATPNTKFRQDPWLKEIGNWVADLPNFNHPAIPEPHRMVLIPEISEEYWRSRGVLYGEIYNKFRRDDTPVLRAA